MTDIKLPYESPNWIYEGNDPRFVEYNSGSVINRVPRQLQENILALRKHISDYEYSTSLIYSDKFVGTSSNILVDSMESSKACTIKWVVNLTSLSDHTSRVSFELIASHNGSELIEATEVSYVISSIIRFGAQKLDVPVSVAIEDRDGFSYINLLIHSSVNLIVRFTRIIVPF